MRCLLKQRINFEYIYLNPSLPHKSSFKWRAAVSGELMFLESYGNCDVPNAVTLLLWRDKTITW